MTMYKFFMDVSPSVDHVTCGLTASTKPMVKADGNKRISFDVDIPDSVIFDVDYHVQSAKQKRKIKLKRKKYEAERPVDAKVEEAE